MQIPVGNFGFRVPQTTQTDVRVHNVGAPGAALEQTGRQLEVLAEQTIERQKQEQARIEADAKRKEDEVNRSRFAKATNDYELALSKASDETIQQLQQGKLARDKAAAHFGNLSNKARSALLETLAPDYQQHAANAFDHTFNRVSHGIDRAIEHNRKSEILGNLESSRDGLAKQAANPGTNISKVMETYETFAWTMGKDAGLTDAEIGKNVQDFKDRATYDRLVNRITLGQDNAKALRGVREEVLKGAWDDTLDAPRKNELVRTVNAHLLHLQQRAEVAARAQERAIGMQLNALQSVIDANGVVSLELRDSVAHAVKGTPYAAVYHATMANYDADLAFRMAPPDQKQTMLNQLNAEIAQRGVSSKDTLDRRNRLERYLTQEKEQLKSDGYSYAVKAGVSEHVPLSVLDIFTEPGKLSARLQQSDRASAYYGQTVSPLTEEESSAVMNAYRKMNPTEKTTWLGQVGRTLGPSRTMALMTQIAPNDPITPVAAMLSGMDAGTNKGRKVAPLLIEGQALLDAKEVKLPGGDNTTKLRASFNDLIGTSILTQDGRNAAFSAVNSVYAKLLREDGHSESSVLDTNLYRRAINLVTGGVMEWNGRQILKPGYGMHEKQARNLLGGVTAEQVKAWGSVAGLSDEAAAEYIRKAPIESVGLGRYRVQAGAGLLHRKDGQPFEMTFK